MVIKEATVVDNVIDHHQPLVQYCALSKNAIKPITAAKDSKKLTDKTALGVISIMMVAAIATERMDNAVRSKMIPPIIKPNIMVARTTGYPKPETTIYMMAKHKAKTAAIFFVL